MRVIVKDFRNRRLSPKQYAYRFLYLVITRTGFLFFGGSLCLLSFLTSLGKSPPPAALLHASGGSFQREKDISQCGCKGADQCMTIIPIGSFDAPHVSREVDPNLRGIDYENEKRRRVIRASTIVLWDRYVQDAWGFDELRPLNGGGVNSYGGIGATIVEALGTLYIMRLSSRYEKARSWVERNLKFDNVVGFVDVHETTTRILGGLISAYQLTGDDMFLEKAEDLGRRLSVSFNSLNGIPYPRCRITTKNRNKNHSDYLSEEDFELGHDPEENCIGMITTQSKAAGLSLEFRALAFHSLWPDIRELRCKADRAVQAVIESGPSLLREEISDELERQKAVESGIDPPKHILGVEREFEGEEEKSLLDSVRFTSMSSYYAYLVEIWQKAISSVGAGPTVDTTATFSTPARGFYEYLTKAWRQGGSCESSLRYPLDGSMHMLLKRAIYESPTGDLYLRSFDKLHNDSEAVVEQSMCYLPAVFHHASQSNGISAKTEDHWHDVAKGITDSCINMYNRFPSQLGGDYAKLVGDIWITKGAYRLQADLIEALFYMWRTTESEEYRNEAWKLFLRIDKECKVDNGAYTILEESTIGNITKGDLMPSEFVGSTLKFLYLTFADKDILSLDKWIFNRVGHPLLVTPGIGALNPCHMDLIR